MDWQPIETAPESEPILIWVPKVHRGLDSAEVVVLYRNASERFGFSFWTNGGANGGIDLDFDHAPTHWARFTGPAE